MVRVIYYVAKKSVKRRSSLTEYFLSVDSEPINSIYSQFTPFNHLNVQHIHC